MGSALFQSLSNILVLVLIAALGWRSAQNGLTGATQRHFLAKLVSLTIPFYLFYSVTSKFTQSELLELLTSAWFPFLAIAANSALALLMIKSGMVRKEVAGVFFASFSGGTILVVGMPMTLSLVGEKGIPSLLVYFFANCFFIWTAGLYAIQCDGVKRSGGAQPALFSVKSLKMLFSPPLLGFLSAVAVVAAGVPVPSFILSFTKSFGSIMSPLAIFFIGATVFAIGFSKLRHMNRDVLMVVLGCYVIRPALVYLLMIPFDFDPMMRKVFFIGAALPVSSVIGVLSKNYSADEEYASEVIGVSTICIVFALPVLLFIVPFI